MVAHIEALPRGEGLFPDDVLFDVDLDTSGVGPDQRVCLAHEVPEHQAPSHSHDGLVLGQGLVLSPIIPTASAAVWVTVNSGG